MITIRKSQDRGRGHHGWLDSRHSFSFADYYDPEHMGFSALRVINDDIVKPGAGFGTHGHRDMEIISFVLEGTIEHKDSEGNIQTLPAGEFQLMSAGQGIYHSEYNASDSADLRFLQIWIQPDSTGGKPGYQQKDFGKKAGLTAIASPDGGGGTLKIKQDMRLHQLILEPGTDLEFVIDAGRNVYLHQVSGLLAADEVKLQPGDGAKIEAKGKVTLANNGAETVTALLFDLP